MTCYEINLLVENLPPKGPRVRSLPPGSHYSGNAPFLHGYEDLSFGWDAAQRLAASTDRFPVLLKGRDTWVLRAWMELTRRPGDTRPRDNWIHYACTIEQQLNQRPTRDVLQAALVARDATCELVALKTGLPLPLVEAYEILFYNVLDRKEDFMFLRNIVHPLSRLDEMLEDAFLHTGAFDKLRRIAFDKGLDEMLHFAGFRTNLLDSMNGTQAAGMFQEQCMVQGAVLARNGFLNAPRPLGAVSAARTLIQSALLAGDDSGGGGDDGSGLGDALRGDIEGLETYGGALTQKDVESMGMAFDVDASEVL